MNIFNSYNISFFLPFHFVFCRRQRFRQENLAHIFFLMDIDKTASRKKRNAQFRSDYPSLCITKVFINSEKKRT